MRKTLKLSSDGGDLGSKNCKRGCDGACCEVWQNLRLMGDYRTVGFVLVRLAGICFQSPKDFFTFSVLCKKIYKFCT
jgi:hypothetical protein